MHRKKKQTRSIFPLRRSLWKKTGNTSFFGLIDHNKKGCFWCIWILIQIQKGSVRWSRTNDHANNWPNRKVTNHATTDPAINLTLRVLFVNFGGNEYPYTTYAFTHLFLSMYLLITSITSAGYIYSWGFWELTKNLFFNLGSGKKTTYVWMSMEVIVTSK